MNQAYLSLHDLIHTLVDTPSSLGSNSPWSHWNRCISIYSRNQHINFPITESQDISLHPVACSVVFYSPSVAIKSPQQPSTSVQLKVAHNTMLPSTRRLGFCCKSIPAAHKLHHKVLDCLALAPLLTGMFLWFFYYITAKDEFGGRHF